MSYKNEFSTLMRESREKQGLSQKALSQELGWTTAQFISNFERGLSLPPMKDIKTICEILKLEPKKVYRLMYEIQKEKLDLKFKGKI